MNKKVSDSVWKIIQAEYESGIKVSEISRKYDIPYTSISSRAKRRQWKKHVIDASNQKKVVKNGHIIRAEVEEKIDEAMSNIVFDEIPIEDSFQFLNDIEVEMLIRNRQMLKVLQQKLIAMRDDADDLFGLMALLKATKAIESIVNPKGIRSVGELAESEEDGYIPTIEDMYK